MLSTRQQRSEHSACRPVPDRRNSDPVEAEEAEAEAATEVVVVVDAAVVAAVVAEEVTVVEEDAVVGADDDTNAGTDSNLTHATTYPFATATAPNSVTEKLKPCTAYVASAR